MNTGHTLDPGVINLKVTTKPLLERNWLFFLERDLSDINLTRPDIGVKNFNYADG